MSGDLESCRSGVESGASPAARGVLSNDAVLANAGPPRESDSEPGGKRRSRLHQAGAVRAALLTAPGVLWIGLFLLVPLLFIFATGFFSRGAYGEIEWPLTWENFRRFAGFGAFGFEPLYPLILARSLLLAGGTVLGCTVVGMPMAFWISRLPARWKTAALVLAVIPLWTNLLIRTYAWQILLAPDSWLARAASAMGWIARGEGLYPSGGAVFLGMVCDYLPFLVLPLYASVEKLDWSLAEAAADLGADRWRVFRHATLPQIVPGLSAGILLVFIPAAGQFVIPDLLGGAKTVLLGNLVQQQFGPSRDWPFGSVMATLFMALVMAGLWCHARAAARRREEGAPL